MHRLVDGLRAEGADAQRLAPQPRCIAVQRVQTLSMALIAILLMPLSLIFVAVLESYGYD